MNPTGKTFHVDCFHNFIEIFLPMSIYDLSNCNCTMVGEEIQEKVNQKKWGLLENQEPSDCLGFL